MIWDQSVIDRLEANSVPVPESGCRLWLGYTDRGGYGSITVNKYPYRTHRVAFEIAHGPIPEGAYVLHSCDVPCCINHHHLFLGDALANITDCKNKGRNSRGEDRWSAVLTEADVRIIRSEGLSVPQIVQRFGISRAAAHFVIVRRTWKHLDG